MKFCDYFCSEARAIDKKGLNAEKACRTFHVMYCEKFKREVLKNQICLEDNRKGCKINESGK